MPSNTERRKINKPYLYCYNIYLSLAHVNYGNLYNDNTQLTIFFKLLSSMP